MERRPRGHCVRLSNQTLISPGLRSEKAARRFSPRVSFAVDESETIGSDLRLA